MSDAHPAGGEDPLEIAVVGVSGSPPCGVRDHAVLLADALRQDGVSCSMHWLWRKSDSLAGARSEFQTWSKALAAELEDNRPDAVLLHYSVFSYSYRGLPLFVRPTLSKLRASRIPLITVLHEFAYPWRRGGIHGWVWAATQRALLIEVMRASAAVLVTASFRADWLASRAWLPRRPAALAPVFSNLPAPTALDESAARSDQVIGLFGYAYEGTAVALVLDALRLLHDRGLPAKLTLLGAPGPGSSSANAWIEGARQRGIEDGLSFSGVLPAGELSNALAACQVLLHPEPAGPTSRKGTLAASLASGSAVVALDGPRGWPELIESEAALVVAPTASALADAVAGLLADEGSREALGARGGAFALREISVQRSAQAVTGLLANLLSSH
jgi:glycosyltransferase involved in cell wall biosynthesis